MALRLLGPGRRTAVLYGRSLRQISASLRSLATKDDIGHDEETTIEVRQLWPSPASDLLGDTDRRLPLPGAVGLAEELSPPPPPPPPAPHGHRHRQDNTELYYDRHMAAVVSFLTPTATNQSAEPAESAPPPSPSGVILEIQAHECPQLLKEEFRPLFRERDICAGRLTVLVVSQRTEGDMATWSEQIEAERAELATHFLAVGKDIVMGLRRLGFWADLVDPSSGRPHLGAALSDQAADDDDADRLVETDDRMARLGFAIEDVGCCKVIRHAVWGSHVFVGCMFTDAAVDDPRLGGVISKYEVAAPC